MTRLFVETIKPALHSIVNMLPGVCGAKEGAWSSDGEARGGREVGMWALCQPHPLSFLPDAFSRIPKKY